ncbi:MAG: hypothetical protein ACR2JE_14155 [Acidobacteriaceae bacterium]
MSTGGDHHILLPKEGYEWDAERGEWVPMRISDDEADYIVPRIIADLWKA